MEKKNIKGAVRSKEGSKQKFLAAVGKILRTKGFSALKVNDIAATAGLDKKLIYNYFGGTDQLIDEYVQSRDFWSNIKSEVVDLDMTDGGQALSKTMLTSQFDHVYRNRELQKILLWGLTENRKSIKRLAEKREEEGNKMFEMISDPHFGEKAARYRAIMALLISGIYYLDIYAATNNNTFCGLDVKSKEGRAEIEGALSFIVDQAYAGV